jgi:uncharacterized protein (DUF4415 family)
MERKRSESSRRAKRHGSKAKRTSAGTGRDRELAALIAQRDQDIDTSDVSEVSDWSKAVVGKFYRPIKAPVTLRLDADVLAWLKSQGPGYQTRVNALLREAMTSGSTHGNDSPGAQRLTERSLRR